MSDLLSFSKVVSLSKDHLGVESHAFVKGVQPILEGNKAGVISLPIQLDQEMIRGLEF